MKKQLFLTKGLLVAFLISFALLATGQQQKVAYYQKYPDGRLSAPKKTQIQDATYGLGIFSSKYTFGYVKDGKVLTGLELKAELDKPIWGPDGDQVFIDLIPDFPKKVPAQIRTPDGEYEWHPFDPDDPSTYPLTEIPESGHYLQRGWECEDATYPGKYYQNMSWRGELSIETWRYLNIFRYRQQKVAGWEDPMITNPEFAIVEEARRVAMEEYVQLLEYSNIVPTGDFKFQSLPVNTIRIQYLWKINDVPMEPDKDHKLAQAGAGWKHIWVPMREPEFYGTRNLYQTAWNTRILNSSDLTKEKKILTLIK